MSFPASCLEGRGHISVMTDLGKGYMVGVRPDGPAFESQQITHQLGNDIRKTPPQPPRL